MRFFTAALGTVVAFAALISAQTTTGTSPPPTVTDSTENPITFPAGGTIGSGSRITIRWTPSTQNPVTLVLRKGRGANSNTITTIASEIPNSGSYDWTPSPSLPVGDDYSIQIISGGLTNYSPVFGIGPLTSTSSSSTSNTTSTTSSSTSSSSSSSSSTTTSSSSSSSATSSSVTTSATSSEANTTISSTSPAPSRSTPTSTSSDTSTSTSSDTPTSTSSGTPTSTSSGTPTSTSSGTPGNGGTTSANGAPQVVSPLALIFFIVAGIAYLN
ncbi:Ser-Thr-rich glycosyl-phosphatidyl-inositol-anchored membrane family-domain-containing protein [Tuber brumale]|nr:Ser-Thr-rich glycosyl-phosphatidyl-inositol-anchored membrane family-domain-containing protein [Tuber brumale]